MSSSDDHATSSTAPATVTAPSGPPATGTRDSWTTPPSWPAAQGRTPVLRPIGWLVMVLGATGLALSSWMLFPTDHPGMFAGYLSDALVLVVAGAATALRCNVPRTPSLALAGLVGVLLVLRGALGSDATAVAAPMIASGIVILVGVGMQFARED